MKKENRFKIKNRILEKNERVIEIPWVLSTYKGQARVLDIGTTFSDRSYFKYLIELIKKGIKEFYCIDIISFKPERFAKSVPAPILNKLIFKKGDVRKSGYPDNFFDLILCVSTIEHIGFDRENINPKEDTSFKRGKNKPKNKNWKIWKEDYKVVKEFLRILKPGGSILITAPLGKIGVITVKDSKERYAQFFQYDQKRVQSLFNRFKNIDAKARYFYFNENKGWQESFKKSPINCDYNVKEGCAGGVVFMEIKKTKN